MRVRTPTLLFCLVMAVSGCTAPTSDLPPPGWHKVETPRFSFQVPPDMKAVAVQGVDSLVGAYKGDSISLSFDYGRFSDPLDYAKLPNYSALAERIGGKAARIVSFENPGSGHPFDHAIGVHFPDTDDGENRLTVFVTCKTQADYRTVRTIFRTIEFVGR